MNITPQAQERLNEVRERLAKLGEPGKAALTCLGSRLDYLKNYSLNPDTGERRFEVTLGAAWMSEWDFDITWTSAASGEVAFVGGLCFHDVRQVAAPVLVGKFQWWGIHT